MITFSRNSDAEQASALRGPALLRGARNSLVGLTLAGGLFAGCEKKSQPASPAPPVKTAGSLQAPSHSPAEKAYHQFPELDPKHARVIKHDIQNIQQLLIVVHFIHSRADSSEEEKAVVASMQPHYTSLAKAILDSYPSAKLSADGMCPEDDALQNEWIEVHRALRADPSRLQSIPSEDRDIYRRVSDTVANDYKSDAATRLAVDYGYKLVGLEDPELLKRALEGKPSIIEDVEALSNPRETAILANAASKQATVTVLLMGASHRFKNNVDEWNERHPEQRFGLIDVMMPQEPYDLKEYMKWLSDPAPKVPS